MLLWFGQQNSVPGIEAEMTMLKRLIAVLIVGLASASLTTIQASGATREQEVASGLCALYEDGTSAYFRVSVGLVGAGAIQETPPDQFRGVQTAYVTFDNSDCSIAGGIQFTYETPQGEFGQAETICVGSGEILRLTRSDLERLLPGRIAGLSAGGLC